MTSHLLRRHSVLLAAVAATVLPAAPAFALPGLDLNAGLYGAWGPGVATGSFGADLDAYVGTPIIAASGHLLNLGGGAIGEGVLRFTPLPLPIIGFHPGVGYQGNTFFSTTSFNTNASLQPGSLDHAPYGSLLFNVAVPLVPVSADVEVGASYPISLGQLVFGYSANVNIFPVPLLPVAVSARYRGYTVGTGFAPALSAVEGGLRVSL